MEGVSLERRVQRLLRPVGTANGSTSWPVLLGHLPPASVPDAHPALLLLLQEDRRVKDSGCGHTQSSPKSSPV